jgi:hypothetical protein
LAIDSGRDSSFPRTPNVFHLPPTFLSSKNKDPSPAFESLRGRAGLESWGHIKEKARRAAGLKSLEFAPRFTA